MPANTGELRRFRFSHLDKARAIEIVPVTGLSWLPVSCRITDQMRTSTVKIRPARESDHLQINHVIEQAVMTWDLPERVKQLSLSSYYYHEHDLEHFHIIVAETGADIVGVAAWERQPITIQGNRQALLLHGIFVAAPRQNRSIGTQLFRLAVEAAKTAGCDGLLVRAQKDAEGFFYKMGMKKLDVEDERSDYAHRFWKPLN